MEGKLALSDAHMKNYHPEYFNLSVTRFGSYPFEALFPHPRKHHCGVCDVDMKWNKVETHNASKKHTSKEKGTIDYSKCEVLCNVCRVPWPCGKSCKTYSDHLIYGVKHKAMEERRWTQWGDMKRDYDGEAYVQGVRAPVCLDYPEFRWGGACSSMHVEAYLMEEEGMLSGGGSMFSSFEGEDDNGENVLIPQIVSSSQGDISRD